MHSVSAITKTEQRRIFTKARKDRSGKTAEWVRELKADQVDEFDLLRKMGRKFSGNTLNMLAKGMIPSEAKAEHHDHMRHGKDEKLLVTLVTKSWIQRL